jgi:hypothetical protein
MNVYHFEDELLPSTVESLIYRIEDTREKSIVTQIPDSDDVDVLRNHIVLYFSTNGGRVSSAHVLSNYFRDLIRHEYCTVEIIITDWCHSAGLLMLMDLYEFMIKNNPPDSLVFKFFQHSEGILHEIATDVHTRNPRKDVDGRVDRIKSRKEPVLNFLKKYLTKSEIKAFKNSDDVIIEAERLAKIFNGTIVKTY